MRISDWSSDVCSSIFVIIVHGGDGLVQLMRQGGRHRSHCTYAGGMNEAGPQLFHFLLRPLPLGQVADKAGEDALIAGRLADRKLDRKCRAVPRLAGDHASDPDDVFFPTPLVAPKIAAILLAVGR